MDEGQRARTSPASDAVTPRAAGPTASAASATVPSAPASAPGDPVSSGSQGVATALARARSANGREQWLSLVGACQGLINALTALQDVALTEVARRESAWCDDGTMGETVHAPGRVTLDAADLAAPALGASHTHAQRRVEQAVRLSAARTPVEADGKAPPEPNGLRGLHTAMAAGRLDGYRASVLTDELEHAPADVAEAVVAALESHLHEEAPSLRRRCRKLLARISPDLLRERAARARAQTGLRRWVAEPGVDTWHGSFPCEDAALAWAAIDRLAHDLVAAGTCSTVEQARGKALTDLVIGNATVDVRVLLTVPADVCETSGAAPDGSSVGGGGAMPLTPESTLVTGEPTASTAASGGAERPGAQSAGDVATIAGQPPAHQASTEGHPPAHQESTEGHPPAHQASTAGSHPPDQASTRGLPPPVLTVTSGRPLGDDLDPRSATAAATRLEDDDLVHVQGARPSEPLLVRRGWLLEHLRPGGTSANTASTGARKVVVPCHPHTGALLDPGDRFATEAYRPGTELAALVRARDGRCRFPGCRVAVRFCDLDHVRPWPTGPTAARSLLSLCRRHHRIKQRPGWRVRLSPDGTTTWTDPAGQVRTTLPLDALESLVLAAPPVDQPVPAHAGTQPLAADGTAAPLTADPAAQSLASNERDRDPPPEWSALESQLAFRLEHLDAVRDHCHDSREGPGHRRCTSAAQLRAAVLRRRVRTQLPEAPPF